MEYEGIIREGIIRETKISQNTCMTCEIGKPAEGLTSNCNAHKKI